MIGGCGFVRAAVGGGGIGHAAIVPPALMPTLSLALGFAQLFGSSLQPAQHLAVDHRVAEQVEVVHAARAAGISKYRLYDLIRLNFDLMTGFSLLPLQLFTLAGLGVAMFSGVFVIFLFIRRLLVGPEAEGLFTLFAILYFLVGVVILGLGIIGEYVGRIYQEVRRRPRYVIREILETRND